MEYFILFLEGIITFISPCLLPMLPIYISYFAGQNYKENISKTKVLKNAFGFVLGFSIIFIIMGAFAGTIGTIINGNTIIFNIITGTIVIIFGLNFTGFIKINFINRTREINYDYNTGFLSSIIFGITFSICWTPCVGAFLGSALTIATLQGGTIKGIFMLLFFSMGLGIPFIISALLIDKLKNTFDFIKRNYKTINIISGCFLIIIGILMMTNTMNKFLSLFA